MASFLTSTNLCTAVLPCKKTRASQSTLQVKAQIHRDHEGRSKNIVDTNLQLLRMRIEEVRNKERLERCCVAEWGWNYAPVQSFRRKRDEEMVQFLQLMGMAGSTFGLTVASCSFGLCMMSFLLHLSQ